MKPSKKLFVIVLSALLLGGCLTVRLPGIHIRQASEPQVLTWGPLVRQALTLNPDLQMARYLVTSSTRNRDIAFGDYLPSVDGGLDRNVSRTTGTNPTVDNMGLNVAAQQSLFNGFGTTGNWLKAGKDLEAMQLAYVEASAGVRFRLRSSYIDIIRLERLVATNHQIYERRKQNSDLVRLRYEAGRENLGSALRAEAITGQADFDVKQTERLWESEALRLARESGGEFVFPIHVEDDLEVMLPKVTLEKAELSMTLTPIWSVPMLFTAS